MNCPICDLILSEHVISYYNCFHDRNTHYYHFDYVQNYELIRLFKIGITIEFIHNENIFVLYRDGKEILKINDSNFIKDYASLMKKLQMYLLFS